MITSVHAFARKIQRAVLRDVLAGEDLPLLEWQLMYSIARFGSCHLAHVTNQTSIDPAHGSRAISALEQKGLVVRREDPENRRRKLISLTPDGIAVFERIWPRARDLLAAVTDQLDRAGFEEFKRLLGALNRAATPLSNALDKSGKVPATQEDNRIPV